MSRYVVKLGGNALDSLSPTSPVIAALARDVRDLRAEGRDVVVVHGGGPQITRLLEETGRVAQFHEGLRVTDEETMEYVAMALSRVNLHLVAALVHAGLTCVGLSGVDNSLLCAEPVGPPWGRIGVAPKVDAMLISTLWRAGLTPVVNPVATDSSGELVNCNADVAAGALAAALDAELLVLLSDVDQLRSDPTDASSALSAVSGEDVRRLVESGAAREGMRPKMIAALDALEGGACTVLLANGTREHALRDALAGTIPTTEVVR
ncbi:MAG: acetylglutamate kinase [Acidimicrobiales bacterium]